MGGLGKTTLAQLVCNDESVKTHFKEKIIWVFVSDPFDVSKIAKKVIKSLSGSNPENSDLDTLQLSLREAVSKMPFLLVLDDVWNEDETLWKQLKVPLMGAAQGSQILVSTRSRKAAEVMETIHFHDLEHLSHSDCWSLFKSIAFKGAEDGEFQELTKVGEDIVWRCKGLPLAVRAVGSLLGCRRTYGYWKHILDSRIWEWDNDILPALLLSYYSLPFHLKRCFSFCSLFPKDYEMKKDELVKLWMAHGLIESKKADIEVDLEEIGEMVQEMRVRRGKPKISSWKKMKCRLRENFFPPDFTQSIFSQFNNINQDNKSVVDYTEEFYKLMAHNKTQEIEEQSVARYIGGLKFEIRDEVEMQRVWRLNDAYQLALKVEAKLTRGHGKKYADVRSFYPPSKVESSCRGHVGSKIRGTNKSAAKLSTSNHGGGQATHTNRSPTCFKCGQVGHYLKDCPKRRVDAHVNLADEES
ncbi:hypothetical protein AAC387_Pa02g2791 [Persea americana]